MHNIKPMRLPALLLLCALLLAITSPVFAATVAFEAGDSIQTLQQKIKQNGYDFTVAPNWVTELSPEERQALKSRRPAELSSNVPEQCPPAGPLHILDGAALPAAYDSRDVNGVSYVTPIKNQQNCGSCYSFGATAGAEGSYNKATGRTDRNLVQFSESYIAWCLGRLDKYNPHFFGCDGSDYDYYELTALSTEGVTYEANFPYQDYDPGSCTHWDDPTVVFDSWHRITCGDRDAIKSAIMQYGVVVAAVLADSGFDAYSSGIYQNSNTQCSGSPCYYTSTNHIVALVGWDDTEGYWILRNSWGTSWGESGYMRIKYGSAVVDCETAYLVYTPSGRVPTACYELLLD